MHVYKLLLMHVYRLDSGMTGSVTLSQSMNINPRGALRPVRNDHESHTDQEEDSPSGHGLRGLSVFLGPLAEEGRQGPEAHHEQEPRLDVEVGAGARSNLRVGADPREVRRIFVDETVVNVGESLLGSGPRSSRTSPPCSTST